MSNEYLQNSSNGVESISKQWRAQILDKQNVAVVELKVCRDVVSLVQLEEGNFTIDFLRELRALPFSKWFEVASQWRLSDQLKQAQKYQIPTQIVLKVAVDEPVYWELRVIPQQVISSPVQSLESDENGVGKGDDEVESQCVYFEGFIIDVTDAQIFQKSVEEEKRFVEDLFRLSGTLFCVLDSTGKIIRHNQTFGQYFGNFSIQDYQRCFHPLIFDNHTIDAIKQWSCDSVSREIPFQFKRAIESKNYIQKWLGWTVVINFEDEEQNFVLTGADITEQELLYKELENANQRLLLRNNQIKDITHKQRLLFAILRQFRTAKDSESIFTLLCKELSKIISYRSLFFFQHDFLVEGQFRIFDSQRDLKESEMQLYFEEHKGILGKVVLEKTGYYSGNVKEDKNYVMHHPDVNSLVLLPIDSNGKMLGILGCDSKELNAFSDVELDMLQLCAEHLGLYLEELMMRNQLQVHSFHLKDLHRIVTSMMNAGNRMATSEILISQALMEHLAVYSVAGQELLLLCESQPSGSVLFGYPHAQSLIEISLQTRRLQQVRIRSQQLFHTCAPIVNDDISYGVLYTMHTEALSEQEMEILAIISNQLGMIWRLDDLIEAIKEEALIDPLTELHNRRYIMRRIQEEQHRIERYPGHASIIMLDLTDFKHVNDEYGHLIGDEVLVAVARLLKQCIRETDDIGRFGGDEFVIVLPNTDREAAQEFIRRMQSALKSTPITDKNIVVSGDFGIVTIPEEAQDILTALKLADGAMYAQKRRTKK